VIVRIDGMGLSLPGAMAKQNARPRREWLRLENLKCFVARPQDRGGMLDAKLGTRGLHLTVTSACTTIADYVWTTNT
jgi:hypothetical protein